VWDAQEAYAKGLLTRVVPDGALAEEVAATVARIGAGAPLVARWHKRFVRRLTPLAAPLTAGELDACFDYFDTADFREGLAAFIARRKPRFTGR
jgi:enoyl-CoA hydratase/carnithine racemase